MSSVQKSFSHNSLQDADSIGDLLDAITDGLRSGKLQLSDDDGSMVLRPRGLLELKVDAKEDGSINSLNLRIRWNDASRKVDRKTLKIR